MNVLLAEHRGLACALPARQIVGAAFAAHEEEIALWPEESGGWRETGTSGQGDERWLLVATPTGPRPLRCQRPRLLTIGSGAPSRLSPILREVLALPHVVGWAELDGELVWLVDLMRWSGS